MNRKNTLRSLLLLLTRIYITGCAPAPLFMNKGEELNDKIKKTKTKVAVLPNVDWSEDPTCCQGYGLSGGLGGLISRGYAYENGGLEFSNEIMKSLWKQNVCFLAKKKDILEACQKNRLTKNELFPEFEPAFLNCLTPRATPIETPSNVGNGQTPNYDKLYKIGNDLGVDLLYISRLSVNAQAKVCGSGLSGIIQSFVGGYRNQLVQVDLIVLDVKKKEVLSFGVFGAGEWLSANQKPEKLDNYGKAMVYYFNMPTDETMRKKALASAASFVTTYVINVFLNTGSSMATSAIGIPMGGGLQLGAEFKFEYNLDDVTWQQYGPTYFDDNYGWKQSEYLQAVSQ